MINYTSGGIQLMTPEQLKELGERIKFVRTQLGLTMEEFIQRIDGKDGKGRSGTVNNWETGKNAPNKRRLKRIAELGNISVPYLQGVKPELLKKWDDNMAKMFNDSVSSFENLQTMDKITVTSIISFLNSCDKVTTDKFNSFMIELLSDSELYGEIDREKLNQLFNELLDALDQTT